MSQLNQFLKDLGKHSDAVKKCTRPLHHLGITCFYYVYINAKGEQVLLTDRPEVDDYYYEQKLYVKDPYLRHPDNYQSGFFFFESNHKKEYDGSLAYLAKTFKIDPIVGLCDKQEDSVEFFGFWGEAKESNCFEQVYLNYASLLKAFASNFKEKCKKIIQPDNGPSLSLHKLLGANEFNSISPLQPKINEKLVRKCLIEIGFGPDVAKAESLSRRERDCLKLLLKGKSMKETAVILSLSPRTVEHYLESVKNKFSCKYKNELFSIAERLFEFGLL